MMHNPVKIENLCLSFPSKTCFEAFSTEIRHGSRIAIIGRNGCGKSSLLNLLRGVGEPTSGHIHIPSDAIIGYVPQVITDFADLSGGERLNRALTRSLSLQPNILLLDEPTNHLDERNRRHVLRWLEHFHGSLLIVSHDVELLRQIVDTFWHIDQGRIELFSGSFDDYQRAIRCQRTRLETSLHRLKTEQKSLHQSLMQEQQRAAKSKAKGAKSIDQRKWPTVVSNAKAGRSQETSGRKKAALANKKQAVLAELGELYIPEIIVPKFHLSAKQSRHMLLTISQGTVGYKPEQWLLQNIYLSVTRGQKIALMGDNGSGKSSLFKAILGARDVVTSGNWLLPKPSTIGYLDQHYGGLYPTDSVFTSMSHLMPGYSDNEIRRHLNDFLFRSQEEVHRPIAQLSGGEKARLSLAHIAAQTPELLLLDEITNNLDLETRQHMIEVLKAYPGSLLVISHDRDFLQAIGIQDSFKIINDSLHLQSSLS
jgi:ATPase subunit of ABC transporter with duplicated ATPase domains